MDSNNTTRRRFVRGSVGAGALALSGLAAADHDNRSEQGEQNSMDGDAHKNGDDENSREPGQGRNGGGDDPGNSGEHRRDDEHRSTDDGEDNGDGDGGDGGGGDGDGDGGDDGDGGGNVQVSAERRDDGSTFVFPSGPGAALNQVDLIVEASRPVFVRDRFPSDWTVVEGDPHTTDTEEDARIVEFTERVAEGTRTYFAEIPDNTGADEFEPIEYSLDGETWTAVPGTNETNLVVAGNTIV